MRRRQANNHRFMIASPSVRNSIRAGDREVVMIAKTLIVMFVAMGGALPARADAGDPIEPNAGNWRTWVISSGRDYRVPPPPGAADTQAELRALALLMSHNDAQVLQQIEFWDAGAPAYRWIDLINSRILAGTVTTPYPQR